MPFTYEFPRPAVTVDVLAVTTETIPRILLIRRGEEPFAGRWAMPGGFVNENEPLEQAARRELEEESGLRVESLQQLATFGDPGRDPRGWTVSVVFWTRLGNQLPHVKAADDAQEVGWFPLHQLPMLAFDHAAIINYAQNHVLK